MTETGVRWGHPGVPSPRDDGLAIRDVIGQDDPASRQAANGTLAVVQDLSASCVTSRPTGTRKSTSALCGTVRFSACTCTHNSDPPDQHESAVVPVMRSGWWSAEELLAA